MSARALEQLEDLPGLGMAPERLLGEEQIPVHCDLEHPARGGDEPDLGVRERLLQLSRQTGGSRLVVSDDAKLDRNAHDAALLERVEVVGES
jgi:hypothetical protein